MDIEDLTLDKGILYLQDKIVDAFFEGNSEIEEICKISISLINKQKGTSYETDDSRLMNYMGLGSRRPDSPLLKD